MGPLEIKQALAAGKTVLGTMMFEFNSPGISPLAAGAGAEFVLFDMEHSGLSIESIRSQMGWSKTAPVTRMVRVPGSQYDYISRVMDVGAQGVMVPMVESVEQATAIAAAMTYPPLGRRGAAFGVAHDHYSGGSVAEKLVAANEQRICITQIETKAGLDNVEAIAAVPGVDVLWVGQFDLTLSMGIPAQFDHPEFLAALDRVVAAARANGKTAAAMATGVEDGKRWIERGFRMIAYSGDLWVYQQGLAAALSALSGK
jgi:2-keto-3-deoxy-L-rhamnonate aldolase RhmA